MTTNIDRELWDSAQKEERKRILKIIKGLSSHSTHGEHCYKLHSFVQLLKRQINGDEDYVTIEFDVRNLAEQVLIDALMNEGILRERERITRLLENNHNNLSWQHSEHFQDSCLACESLQLFYDDSGNPESVDSEIYETEEKR